MSSDKCSVCGRHRMRHSVTHTPDGWKAIDHPYGEDPRRLTGEHLPVRTMTRREALSEGFVESTDPTAIPPKVGDEAIVHARGDLRLGIVSKVGRTTVYVSVATPTSPDLVTQGKIGGRWQERGYLRSSEPYVACLDMFTDPDGWEPRDRGTRCWLRKGHDGSHEGQRGYGSRSYGYARWA